MESNNVYALAELAKTYACLYECNDAETDEVEKLILEKMKELLSK